MNCRSCEECKILILSACTPELLCVNMFDSVTLSPWQPQFKRPFMHSLWMSSSSLFLSHCSPGLLAGLCFWLWRGHFGQWLWTTADHPRGQTWQYPGRLRRLLAAGTGTSDVEVLCHIGSTLGLRLLLLIDFLLTFFNNFIGIFSTMFVQSLSYNWPGKRGH